ncbi:MAG: hypothetical protein BWK79_04725 [Beggiatoa sp. IS2]|nr:MAG: hypothetical protein BWK79_04725 [Beggiatoa sp. IS2]
MDDSIQLSELQRDVITELLNIGMGQAAASLSEMVKEEVKLSVPTVEMLSRSEAARSISDNPQKCIAAVKQQFTGPFWGDALLLFPQDKSLEVVRVLMKDEIPLDMLTELEQDALTEVGNIILNGCLSSFGNSLTHEITSDLPVFMMGTALEVLGGSPAIHGEGMVMFLRMEFALHSKDINGYVAFILEIPSIEQFKQSVNTYLGQF